MKIKFLPKPSITAYELAQLLAKKWGNITLTPGQWRAIPPEMQANFEIVSGPGAQDLADALTHDLRGHGEQNPHHRLRTIEEMYAHHAEMDVKDKEPKQSIVNNSALLKKIKERSEAH